MTDSAALAKRTLALRLAGSPRVHERVNGATIDAYRRDGAVCLRGLLGPGEVHTLRAGIDANLAQPSPRAKVASRADDPGRFIEDFCCWLDNPDYQRTIFETPLAQTAADVVCFHMLALHAAAGAVAGRRRRVFSLRFLGDDVRHAPRRWATSPQFPGLAEQLAAGAPMHHPLFPLLWEQGDAGTPT